MLLSTQAHAIIRHKMESCLRVLTSRSLLRVTSPSARRHSNNGCKLLAASHLSDSAVRRCPSSWNTDSNDATASLKTQMFKLYADPEASNEILTKTAMSLTSLLLNENGLGLTFVPCLLRTRHESTSVSCSVPLKNVASGALIGGFLPS